MAVGGGSSIDTAKAIDLMTTNPGELMDYVNKPVGGGQNPSRPLKPLVAVPTTTGTGAESTTICVLDVLALKVKTGISHARLRPTMAVIDPALTLSQPAGVTAASGMDILCHALESYTARPYTTYERKRPEERVPYCGANPIADMWAEKAMSLLAESFRTAVLDGSDTDARGKMAMAATFAGMGFGNAGVHIPHANAYPIAGRVKDFHPADYPDDEPMIPHGMSVRPDGARGVPVHLRRLPGATPRGGPAPRPGVGRAERPGRVPSQRADLAHARHRDPGRHRRGRLRRGRHRRPRRGHDEAAAAPGHRSQGRDRGRRGRHLHPLAQPVVTGTPTPDDGLLAALTAAGIAEVDGSGLARALYSSDASLYRVLPRAVVRPRHPDEIVATLETCRALGVPVTARGAGTSIAGNAVGPGVVLDTSRHLSRVRSIDPEARTATIDPGVVQSALQKAAAPHGLRFGPDPSTHNRCTVGGMIGNNACGSRALGYGRTSDNVVGLDVVTGGGARLRLGSGSAEAPVLDDLRALVAGELATIRTEFGRFGRQVSGYSLEHLLPERGFDVARALVGSEGTLALVLGATVRLVTDAPHRGLVVLGYPSMAEAADATPGLLPHSPTAVEGLDARIVQRLRDVPAATVPDLPRGEGWLIVELTGDTVAEIEATARPGGRRLGRAGLAGGHRSRARRRAVADPRGRRGAGGPHERRAARACRLGGRRRAARAPG